MSDPIDFLLAESELQHDTALRGLLGEIEREATAVLPMPSAELAALMSPHLAGARRTRRRSFAGRSAVITGIAVIGALGLGATAAAASPEARSAIGAGVAAIAHLFEPAPAAQPPYRAPRQPGSDASEKPSPEPTTEPSSAPSSGPTSAADGNSGSSGQSGDSQSGGSNSGESHDGSGGGNGSGHGSGDGDGNQSGHGNGDGKGNGGPAPTD